MAATAHRRRGLLRRRGPELALATVCVVAAGVLSNVAGQEMSNEATVAGTVGSPVSISRTGQTLEVTRVESGDMVRTNLGEVTTPGNFLVVRLELRSPGDAPQDGLSCTVQLDGHELEAVTVALLVAPQPGFLTHQDLLFERGPGSWTGARLLCRPVESILAYQPVFAIDLDQSEDAVVRGPISYAPYPETVVLR